MGRGFGGRSFGGGSRGGGFRGRSYRGRRYYDDDKFLFGFLRIGLKVIFIVIVLLIENSINSPPTVRESTACRQPLAVSAASGDVYYNRWNEDPNDRLVQSMTTFYKETGVTVHLYHVTVGKELQEMLYDDSYVRKPEKSFKVNGREISYNQDGDDFFFLNMPTEYEAEAFAEHLYDELFNDESHMLVLYFYHSPLYFGYGTGETENIWYYCGEDAATVIDKQAGEIFLDYVELYRYNNGKRINNDVFADAFEDTATLIMSPPTYRWLYKTVGWILGITLLVLLGIVFYKKNKNKNKRPDIQKSDQIEYIDEDALENNESIKIAMKALDTEK